MRTDGTMTLDRGFMQDPNAVYRALRAQAPAHQVMLWRGLRVWLVTRYTEARQLLADPRLTKDADRMVPLFPPGTDALLGPSLRAHVLLKDPPDHTRLRRLSAKAFTPRTVERLQPEIVHIADDLLSEITDGPVDLIEDFAMPLPLRVIGEMLGVPPADSAAFRACVEPILTTTDPAELRTAEQALTDLLSALIDLKRTSPADDVLTGLVRASAGNDHFTENELLSTAFLLILAGYETTVNLLGNGILSLLRHPEQLTAVRAGPALLPSAVEEFLRVDSPINIATVRATTERIRLGVVEIPADELVMIALQAANRDEQQFEDPDVLNVSRSPNPHLAFGHGIHHCLGAPLARLEARLAIGRLLATFDEITLNTDDELRYRGSILVRGLVSLPVHVRRRRP